MATRPKSKKKTKVKEERPLEQILDDEGIEEMDDSIDLDAIEGMIEDIDDLPLYLKILVYGDQGTGKTTFAGTAPNVAFVDCNEEGTFSVRGQGHKRFKVRKWDTIEGIYWYLKTREHQFKTVVIDTTTQGADLAMNKVLEDDDFTGLPIRKHWGQSTSLQKTWWIRFRNLDMHVIFICQLKRIDEEDLDDDDGYTKVPMLSPAVRSSLGAAVGIIGYMYHKEVEKEMKGGKKKRYTSYRMRIGPHPEILTKVRLPKHIKYPAVIEDPTFDKLFEIITKEV
jgi:hypothetical protein